jgi:hypothetical protein
VIGANDTCTPPSAMFCLSLSTCSRPAVQRPWRLEITHRSQ